MLLGVRGAQAKVRCFLFCFCKSGGGQGARVNVFSSHCYMGRPTIVVGAGAGGRISIPGFGRGGGGLF